MSSPTSKLPPVKRNSRAQSPPKCAPAKKFTVQQMDSSAYRLSRPRTNLNNINTSDKPESWAENYYNTEAGASIDKRLPNEKLKGIDNELSAEDLDYKAKLKLLIQKKQLKTIIYGENSIEALESIAEVGYYYNHNERPTSALRHLQKAYSLESVEAIQEELTERLKNEIDIEIAEAHYSIFKTLVKSEDKKEVREARKNLSQANAVLNRIQQQPENKPESEEDEEEDNENDSEIQFRISILRARVLSSTNHFSQAVCFYTEAMNIHELAYGTEPTLHLADLHREAADNAHKAVQNGDAAEATKKAAAHHYRLAYDLYINKNANSEAKKIKPLLDQYENEGSTSNDSDIDSDSDKPVDVKAADVQPPYTADKSEDSEGNNEPVEEYKPITTDDKVYTPPSSSSSSSSTAKSSQNSSPEASPREDKIKLGGASNEMAAGLLEKSDDFDDDDSFESKESFETEKKAEDKKSDSDDDDDFESKEESNDKKSSSSESDDESKKSDDESKDSDKSDSESNKSDDDFEPKEDSEEKDNFMAGSGDENEGDDEFGFEI